MRLTMPVSTLPAPSSAKRVTAPSPASHRMLSRQRTRAVTCSTSWRRIASGSLVGRAVTLATRKARGATMATSASASAISSAAGCISAQWKGAETLTGMARAPSSLAFSMARATAAAVPEITTLPALLSLATAQTPTSAPTAAAASASATSVFGPISAAMAPSPTGTARCIASPRRRSSRAVSASVSAPAAASAEYSPSEWPATKPAFSTGTPNSRSSVRETARLMAISAGWVFSVRVRVSIGPSRISFESFSPSASSTSSNTSRAVAKASARSAPMPTAWLPCPGKMKAKVMLRVPNG